MGLDWIIFNTLLPPTDEQKGISIDEKGITTKGDSNLLNVSDSINLIVNQFVPKFVEWGTYIITALFIIGLMMMILSSIFKIGQWQKFGQSTMLFSFIGLLCLRAIPIVILSFQSDLDIDQAFAALLPALSQLSIFLGLAGILLSFLSNFAYKLIEHPEYHRWSKNTLSVSIVMIFLAIVGPLFYNVL